MPKETEQAKKARAVEILKRLRVAYPNAGCELVGWKTPLELAVAAILSAQCTDQRVNMVTPALFKKYHTAADWAATPQDTLEAEIRSTGFFRNKAKNIRALAAAVVEKFSGELPSDLDTLIGLPGIGRKTANLLIATVFGQPGIIVDTHFKRLSQRLAFTTNDDPDKIEFDLKTILPEKDWTDWSHGMVFHGRRCCFARKPNCSGCPIAELCPSCGKV